LKAAAAVFHPDLKKREIMKQGTVEIHVVHRGNKWMGSLDLETSNKRTTS